MHTLAIEQPVDADLRLSQHAMHRAARRAHELALQTGTTIVVFRHGVVEHLQLAAMVRTGPHLFVPDGSDQ